MDNCLISDCLAVSNAGIGFYLGWNSAVSHCGAAYNGSQGFYAGRSSTIVGSSAIGNGSHGFIIYHGAVISDCSSYRNSGDGINAYADAAIHRCTASENAGDGISANGGSCVNDCLAVLHTNANAAGIRLTTGSTASRNTCRNNYYGIYAAGHCAVTDNHLVQNTNGVFASLAGAFVIRNQASGSVVSNYSLAQPASYGPVVSGSGVITNTNPFANLSQ